jgi:hypothetical protein
MKSRLSGSKKTPAFAAGEFQFGDGPLAKANYRVAQFIES